MHELSVANAIVSTIVEALPPDAPRVEEVHVRIGMLSAVVPEALQFAYDVAAQGTPLADAVLVIERDPVVVYCPQCDDLRELPTITDFHCPSCGTATGDVRSGAELEITHLVLEDIALAGDPA